MDVMDKLRDASGGFRTNLNKGISEFNIDLARFRNDFESHGPIVPGISPAVAMERLKRFIQEAEHIAALLPPQLRDFSIIKEEETVAAALDAPSFVAAQQAMQSAPNDPNNLTALQAEIAKVMPIYTTAIQTRLQEDGISATCRKVIQAGNEDFEGVYQNVWDMTNKSDEKGCEATEKAIDGIVLLFLLPFRIIQLLFYQHFH